jgi:hypothetical protein
MIGTFRASARDPRLSHAEALRQSMLFMIDAAKSDAEADPRLWRRLLLWESQPRRSDRQDDRGIHRRHSLSTSVQTARAPRATSRIKSRCMTCVSY